MKTPRCPYLLLVAGLTLACSGTHSSTDAGPRVDAGALFGDAGDRPADAGAPEDASTDLDAGPPQLDAGRIGTCAPRRIAEAAAEGCFCSGPIALRGEVLYRQAIGIEVFDVSSPAEPRLVRVVEERAGSEGGLAIVGQHLFSVTNFAPMHVYDLADPLDPQLVAILEMDGYPSTLAISDGLAAIPVARDAGGSVLLRVDVRDPEQPRLLGETPIGDRDWGPITADAGRAFVTETRLVEGGDPVYELREITLSTGESQVYPFEPRGALAAADGRLYAAGLDNILRVFEPRDGALIERGRHPIAGEFSSAISARSGRVLVASQTLSVFDAADPTQTRLAGESVDALSASWIESSATHAFLSNGGRLEVFALDCE